MASYRANVKRIVSGLSIGEAQALDGGEMTTARPGRGLRRANWTPQASSLEKESPALRRGEPF